jgi:hypothetical protein
MCLERRETGDCNRRGEPMEPAHGLQVRGGRRTVPLRRSGATALGTLRRALVAGSEVGDD